MRGDQRGDHQGDAGQQQGRHLIAHRFPRSRGHDGQHIPPGQQCVDDLLLTAPEGVIAEILLQNILLCHSRSPLFPAKHTPEPRSGDVCSAGVLLQVGHLKPAPRPSGALPACQFKSLFVSWNEKDDASPSRTAYPSPPPEAGAHSFRRSGSPRAARCAGPAGGPGKLRPGTLSKTIPGSVQKSFSFLEREG